MGQQFTLCDECVANTSTTPKATHEYTHVTNLDTNRDRTDTTVVEFTRLGWNVSTEWLTPINNWNTFTAVMHTAGKYNNFDGHAIANTFKPLFNDSMRIEFGREGSPAMYISIPYFPHQRHHHTTHHTSNRYTDEERQHFATRIINWAHTMRADEINVTQTPQKGQLTETTGKPGPKPHRIRLWWD